MIIRWFGHSCFGLTASDRTKILTDPFDESVGYMLPKFEAAAVTISHGHFDHAYTKDLPGAPRILREDTACREGAVEIRTVRTFHDAKGGRQRGENLMFHFTADGLHVLHAGDLGHVLSAEQILACGRVDILMIPVGGTYTIDGKTAQHVVDQLHPRLVLPMHYRTDALAFPLEPVDPFLSGRVFKRVPYEATEVTEETLPAETEILVLSYV